MYSVWNTITLASKEPQGIIYLTQRREYTHEKNKSTTSNRKRRTKAKTI